MNADFERNNSEDIFGPPANLTGIVYYKGELAQRGYRLNKFLVDISHHEHRVVFQQDESAAIDKAGLSAYERELIQNRDYEGMLAYGVNIYAIAKAGYVFNNTLLEIGQAMRTKVPQTDKGVQ